MDLSHIGQLSGWLGNACYVALAACGLWGVFSLVMVWRRVGGLGFRREAEQDEFFGLVESALAEGRVDEVATQCQDDPRAVPQLIRAALTSGIRDLPKLRHLMADRFQRDVLAELDYRVSWVNTMIKTAPMLGLFGTVLGMMAAFGKIGSGDQVAATNLAGDISLALITTALGLAIAIPLSVAVASVTIGIRKLEDAVSEGLTRFLDGYRLRLGGPRES